MQVVALISTEGVFALKNVRLFYTKNSRMRFVSHLDMTRFMTRIIRRAHLPVWYTEGFNPHLYLTFALPLSLGMESDYEVMDIRITDDTFDIGVIPDRLNEVCPPYIRFFDVCEPVLKAGAVAFADFVINFDDDGALCESLNKFFVSDSIVIEKKTKKGEIKSIEVADKIVTAKAEISNGNTILNITLPAGSTDNLNPELILSRFFERKSDEKNNFVFIIVKRKVSTTGR